MGRKEAWVLSDMADQSVRVSRRCFMSHVNRESLREVGQACGYQDHHTLGMTMASDWHVSYERGKFGKMWCYFFVWSGIEFLFLEPGDVQALWSGESNGR